MEPLISIKDMHKIYNPGENEVRALDGVSLEIHEESLLRSLVIPALENPH